ncbi:MAG: D-aminoacyl-tRNA deacylase, partial [Halobacteriaceae archaeon]
MIGIVVSKEDTASQLIGENLRDLRDWDTYTDESLQSGHGDEVYQCDGFEMRIFDDLHLSLSDVSSLFNSPDLIIFASRHAGDTGPLLTTHFTGNFGSADYGGDPTELAIAAPYAQRRIYHALRKNAPPAYDVGIECTHHGPTNVGSPSLFVEIGSDAEQWQDTSAAKAVAQSILAVEGINVQSNKQIVWFGGGHYASRPEKIIKETDWSVGHIAADWSLTSLGSPQDHTDVIQQVFEKSDATKAVIEGDHTSLSEVISQLGYQVTSETWIRETDGVALSLVAQLER